MASYFSKALTLTNGELVETMRYALHGTRYDTIVGTGLSGTIFTARVAPGLSKKFAIVRKPDDQSNHSGARVEGTVGDRFVFADDFICSGETMRRVLEEMHERYPNCEFVGVYQYQREEFMNVDETTYQYGNWVKELAMGPVLGPLTRSEFVSKHPYDQVVLTMPRTGWDPAVVASVPLPDRRRIEVDFIDGNGEPTLYDVQNRRCLKSDDPRVKPLIAEVVQFARERGLNLRRICGMRMDAIYPSSSVPSTSQWVKVSVNAEQTALYASALGKLNEDTAA